MKKLKSVCLILLSFVLMITAVSCSGDSSDKLTVKVIFTDHTQVEEKVLFETEIKIGTSYEPPTVIQAAEQALTENGIPYSLSKDEAMLTGAFDHTNTEYEDPMPADFTGYKWHLLVNGNDEAEGLANELQLRDGDTVKYVWTAFSVNVYREK